MFGALPLQFCTPSVHCLHRYDVHYVVLLYAIIRLNEFAFVGAFYFMETYFVCSFVGILTGFSLLC